MQHKYDVKQDAACSGRNRWSVKHPWMLYKQFALKPLPLSFSFARAVVVGLYPLYRALVRPCVHSLSLSLSLADGEKPHKVSERDAECADKGFNGGKSARS